MSFRIVCQNHILFSLVKTIFNPFYNKTTPFFSFSWGEGVRNFWRCLIVTKPMKILQNLGWKAVPEKHFPKNQYFSLLYFLLRSLKIGRVILLFIYCQSLSPFVWCHMGGISLTSHIKRLSIRCFQHEFQLSTTIRHFIGNSNTNIYSSEASKLSSGVCISFLCFDLILKWFI